MIGLFASLVLLGALGATVGLHGTGWVVGALCAVVTNGALARGLAENRVETLGPGDRVTLARATLVSGVAALVADSFAGSTSVRILVSMTCVALVLDWVDGQVARRTRTESWFGAQFDMEVDALLILVLSVYVTQSAGPWVIAIGAARYALLAAGWPLSWLREATPPRYWGKVVAATQGIVLVAAAADVLPRMLTDVALVGALVMLAESFGRQVWWLWRHRLVGAAANLPGSGAREMAS